MRKSRQSKGLTLQLLTACTGMCGSWTAGDDSHSGYISPHSKAARGWWAHFDIGKASQGCGSPWRPQLAHRPVKNISACHQGQGWPYTGESHVHLFPEDGLELWGTRGFHPSNCCHFIPCWSNSAHYCLPLGKFCSLLSLEAGVLCVFLTRSSTQDVRREWKGLCHFMSLPDRTFPCILCNLSPQESLAPSGPHLQHSVHQVLAEGCFLPGKDEAGNIPGNWSSPSCIYRSGHGVWVQRHGALLYYGKLVMWW